MEQNFENISLAIHRVEVIDFRDGAERVPQVTAYDTERIADHNFEGLAAKNFRHLLSYWSFSSFEIWTRIELYQNDVMTKQILITTGIEKQLPKKQIG